MEVHDVVGYAVCTACGEALVLDVVARRTGGICVECLDERGEPIREIEVLARGTRIPIPVNGPSRKGKKRPRTAKERAHERLTEKCRHRARKRLQAIFPDLYDILLADERAAAGLDPWPLSCAVQSGPDPDASQTEAFARLYHALEDRGVDA